MEGGDELMGKFAELSRVFEDLRSYEGPFDPHFPRVVFHMLFCYPLRCSLDPLETYGIVQRILHSKDGKHLEVFFGDKPGFRRVDATAQDKKAVALLRSIREIALRHQVWVTYKDKETGSWFPPISFMAGARLPSPGTPFVVSFSDYFERLREFDRYDPPPEPGELIPSTVDMTLLARAARAGAEIADPVPDLCSTCGARLLIITGEAPAGLEGLHDPKRCPECDRLYVRPPREEELTPAERERTDLRDRVLAEFVRRIQEEFLPSPEDLDDEPGYLFGSDGEGWKLGWSPDES